MPSGNWRSPETYKALQTANAATFAWEVLQRNPAFQVDLRRVQQQMLNAGAEQKEEIDSAFAARWGLRFRP